MNLEQLRTQAKELVRAARGGDADALARLGGREPTLASAQLVLARGYGYSSWPGLVATAEASVDAFVVAATDNRRQRAERLLVARPAIERGRWARLVLGRGWDGDPSTVGGPRNWTPLGYVCNSCFASHELVGELLRRGADPNTRFDNEYGPITALYGAAGLHHDPDLTRLLLEAGADPNDNESLYHSVESEDPTCLRLLLEHGVTTDATNALAHRSTTSTRSSMSASCWRREPTRTKARTSRTRCAGAEAPNSCGCWQNTAVTSTDPAARPGAATSRSGRRTSTPSFAGVTTPLPSVFDVDAQEVVIMAALEGQLDVVLETVGPDVRGVVGGSPEGPLLGHAAWVGNADVVRRLLEAGADPNDHAQAEYASPLAIAAHGSGYPGNRGDHVTVAELLVAAGNTVEPRFLEVAGGPLYDWLEARLN